jgi:hypothetical protein
VSGRQVAGPVGLDGLRVVRLNKGLSVLINDFEGLVAHCHCQVCDIFYPFLWRGQLHLLPVRSAWIAIVVSIQSTVPYVSMTIRTARM